MAAMSFERLHVPRSKISIFKDARMSFVNLKENKNKNCNTVKNGEALYSRHMALQTSCSDFLYTCKSENNWFKQYLLISDVQSCGYNIQ